MAGRAVVCGGSIGGCFAAAALLRAGWEVVVLERAGVELSGRGAGIVTHDVLEEALRAVGAGTSDLGVQVEERVAFDRSGRRIATVHMPQIVTSWDRIHGSLRRLIPDGAYRLGASVIGARETAGGAEALLEGGARVECDVVIGADGFRSAVRGSLLSTVQPRWSGYVVWRTLAREQDLEGLLSGVDFGAFGFFLPEGMQAIGYPIAGPGNDLRPGRRRYNFVWYLPVSPEALSDMLTDAQGRRHKIGIPPPLVRDDVVEAMRSLAEARLPPQFRTVLRVAERPFVAPVYDHVAPTFARGHVALAGDAACVARPHVGMGVTKAALDALALARHLSSGAPVETALASYSIERQPAAVAAHAESRRLGSFITDGSGDVEGKANPRCDEVMRRTAVVVS